MTTEDWLTEAVETKLDGGGCKVVKSEITDSKRERLPVQEQEEQATETSSGDGVMAKEDQFREWLRQVDTELAKRCGLSHDDLADQPWWDWFNDGFTPALAVVPRQAADGSWYPRRRHLPDSEET
jgi:hypothetical protein